MAEETAAPQRSLDYVNNEECQLHELVQYECEVGKTHIECRPLVRLFYRCAGKPMVEVTVARDQRIDTTKK
ncbi:hypothetical protein BC940DRAFT_293963 [Gongronella butleri]|nr:hypothetical protein BC940DRAFT_293963 [Gongronella butleri]